MKVKYKGQIGELDVDADVENVVKKGMDNYEKDWKLKFQAKHKAKKEMAKLKHSQKIEMEKLKENKRSWIKKILDTKREERNLRRIEQEKIRVEEEKKRNKRNIRNISIILFLVIGLFCGVGIRDGKTICALISSIQLFLLFLSILMCEDVFHLFEKDHKILFIISILLTAVWLIFV